MLPSQSQGQLGEMRSDPANRSGDRSAAFDLLASQAVSGDRLTGSTFKRLKRSESSR